MEQMRAILIDTALNAYIEASRKTRFETPNEILRRALKIDDTPIPAKDELVEIQQAR